MEDRLLTSSEVLEVLTSTDEPQWPTFTVCLPCGGTTGYYSIRTGQVYNRLGATQLRLLQHGWYMAKWAGKNVANSRIIPRPCTCDCRHCWADIPGPRPMFDHLTKCQLCGLEVRYDSSD